MTAVLKFKHEVGPLHIVGRKNYINKQVQSSPLQNVKFTDFIKQTVSFKARHNGPSYVKVYNSLIGHLKSFEELYDVDIITNSVNEEFLYDFISYLEKVEYGSERKKLRRNYIKHLISLVKAMVNEAEVYNYAIDPTFRNVNYEGEEPFSIYLSLNEISRIYFFDRLSKKQEKIRDLFVVGCLTGLRYSDYSKLEKEHFQDGYIVKLTQKTKVKVRIPIHEMVQQIFDKYEGSISPGVSLQHFNRTIKIICKKVGLDEVVQREIVRDNNIVTEKYKKYELICSHTARRSAATNMYRAGIPAFSIMKITGHTTEKSFFKYIKITQEDAVRTIAGHSFFRI